MINGTTYDVPKQYQLSLSDSGLSANTLYWIYVHNSSGTLALEASTTNHTVSTTTGNVGTEIKSGDDTRSLVGLVYTNASGEFQSDPASRLVISWFNRRELYMAGAGTNTSTASKTWIDVGSGNHLSFVSWGSDNESFWVGFNGSSYASKAGSSCQNVIAFLKADGTQGQQITAINGFWGPAAYYWTNLGQSSQMSDYLTSAPYGDQFLAVTMWQEVGDTSGNLWFRGGAVRARAGLSHCNYRRSFWEFFEPPRSRSWVGRSFLARSDSLQAKASFAHGFTTNLYRTSSS